MQERIRTSVAIVGAGPVGATIANLLGVYGIQTTLIDRSPDILEYPRAVGMDDEALRVFQTAGLAESLLDDMIQNVSLRMFTAKGEMFADIRPKTREFGWYRRNIFMQQLAERTLRDGLARFPHVTMRLGTEVTALQQDEQGVCLTVHDSDGSVRLIEADYCVGSDGGRSTLRGLLNVELLGETHPIKWLVVDVRNGELDAPYTALHCNPRRPNVCINLPFNYRRWEFMVFPHEDPDALVAPDSVRQLLSPYVPDAQKLDIVRARIYTHHSRVASRFVVGRTILAGDAAHLSPPWIGQGLNIGLRDAGNVAWKLAALVQKKMHPKILASYESERRDHAKAMIDLADTFGRILMPTNSIKATARDVFFKSIGALPKVRDYVLQMRFKPMPRYRQGLVVNETSSAGRAAIGHMFIQPDVELDVRQKVKLDEALGPWFAVVGWRVDPYLAMDDEARQFWQGLNARFIRVERSRSGLSRLERVNGSEVTQCIEDVENVLEDWFAKYDGSIVVLRPDRYVAALTQPDKVSAMTRQFAAQVR